MVVAESNKLLYEIIDYSVKDFIPAVGNIEKARTIFLNILMRQHVISRLRRIFATGDIIKLALRTDSERLYDFYIKCLKAAHQENEYKFHRREDGKVIAITGPNGLEIPG